MTAYLVWDPFDEGEAPPVDSKRNIVVLGPYEDGPEEAAEQYAEKVANEGPIEGNEFEFMVKLLPDGEPEKYVVGIDWEPSFFATKMTRR